MNYKDKPPAFLPKETLQLSEGMATFNGTQTQSCDRCGMFYTRNGLVSGKSVGKSRFRLLCTACALPKTKIIESLQS